jgi:hypothetical protein
LLKKMDDNDVYSQKFGGTAYYYVINVMLVLYAIGFVASLVLIQNAHVMHTHHKGNVNGPLYSNRFNSMFWVALVLCVCRLWTFLVVNSMILYRKTQCCGNSSGVSGGGCTIFWSLLLVVCVVADYLVLAILGAHYRNCNGFDQLDNPCNDYQWCCVEAVYVIGSNLCCNTCTPFIPASALKPNPDFLWLFWTTVAFCVFDLVFLLMPLGMWLTSSTAAAAAAAGGENDDFLDTKQPPPEAAAARLVKSRQTTAAAVGTRLRQTPLLFAAGGGGGSGNGGEDEKMTKQP